MATLALQPSLLDPEVIDRPDTRARAHAGDRGAVQAAASVAVEDAPASGGRTLEDLLVGAWEELTSTHAGSCLLCGGTVRPRYGAGAKPVAATCRDCGTEIS
jgi:hypothetical protein